MVLGERVFELRMDVEAREIPSLPEGFTPVSDSDLALMVTRDARAAS